MDNKKPLILVPPMSEPMKKLKEVLEGIAAEENIDIFSVEDQKEFGQLVGSGGQALVIMSNAKLCATLLQEYRSIIAKNHTKVILLTPKEIPAKTLVKFTKIGLTESILENSPPKTLLYKVKLLLRSIKVVQKEETNQQLIKSMLDLGHRTKMAEEILNEKNADNEEGNQNQNSNNNKKNFSNDDEGGLDYLSNLTGKKKQSEDVIETHWKTKKEKEFDLDLDNTKSEEDKNAINDIDMYYRGRKKIEETEIDIDREHSNQKHKDSEEEEVDDHLSLKRKKETINEIEISKKEDERNEADEEIENPNYNQGTGEEIQLNLEKSKRHEALDEETDEDLNDIQNKLLKEIEIEKEKKNRTQDEEEANAHYKGKITNQDELELESDDGDKNTNDSTEIELEREKKKEAINDESDDSEINRDDKINELALEKQNSEEDNENEMIDNYLRGKIDNAKTIELNIEETEKQASKETVIELDSNSNQEHSSADVEIEVAEKNNQNLTDKTDLEDGELRQEKLLSEVTTEEMRQEQMVRTDDLEDLEQKENKSEESNEKEHRQEKMMTLDDDNELNDVRKNENENEDDLNRKAARNKGLDLEAGDPNNVHEGKTEHITTYYKTGENKSKDQDWNLPQNKKDTIISLKKTKSEDINIEALKRTNSGEITIDYRKLKEEFEQLSRGELAENSEFSSGNYQGSNGQKIIEDQYKVFEVNPGGFEFAIEIINLLYSPDLKNVDIYRIVAEQLLKEHKAYITTYQYVLKDKSYTESFNTYLDFSKDISDEIKNEFNEIKESKENLALFASFSMPTYLCRSIPDNGSFWRDIELPQWADKELFDKKMELIYPFFDGVDRMGYAHIYFPNGINPKNDKSIQVTIEMLRTVFLDTIQRSKANEDKIEEKTEAKNNVLDIFSGFFGKKKAS